MRNRAGFTIIEMLTVIAIMGVLAAIIYPVFITVKEKTRNGACMTNLHNVWSAVRRYRMDERAYPTHLLYQELDENGKNVMSGLYPTYCGKELSMFTCPVSGMTSQVAVAVPDCTPRGAACTVNLYPFSTYDAAAVNGAPELRYALRRTDGPTPVAATDPDFQRQLMFPNAPENTVVTWCSYHRKSEGNVVTPKSSDIFLWLSGQVKMITTQDVAQQLGATPSPAKWWRVKPTTP